MAFCTRCGSKVDDGAAFCSGCGAPVAPIGAAAQTQERGWEEADDELFKAVNKKELKWFIITTVLGFLVGCWLVASADMSDVSISAAEKLISRVVVGVFAGMISAGYFYGIHYFHPIRRYIFKYWLLGLIPLCTIGNIIMTFGGLYFWYPRAWFRLLRRKPLLKEEEILNLIEKDLIDIF